MRMDEIEESKVEESELLTEDDFKSNESKENEAGPILPSEFPENTLANPRKTISRKGSEMHQMGI